MSDVEFQDNWSVNANQAQIPKIINFVITHSGGLIKNQKQATLFLFILAIVIAGISIYIFTHGSGEVAPINSITTPDVLPENYAQ